MKRLIVLLLLLAAGLGAETVEVHYIDVGQGDAILIQKVADSGKTYNYLIDAGKPRSDDKLLNYLEDEGVDTLHACLLTHPHYDHYGEFEDVIESGVVVKEFIKNEDYNDNSSFNSLMSTLESYNIPITIVDEGSDLNWQVDTKVLSPEYNSAFDDYNNNSVVVLMKISSIEFLFMGDSEEENNNRILQEYDLSGVSILKAGHHGSSNGTNQAFLDELMPGICVYTAGNNSYGHPSHEVSAMLQNIGCEIYSTADDWDTWTGNGSSDYSVDDDIVIEVVDSRFVYANGEVVENVYRNYADLQINAGWNLVSFPFDVVDQGQIAQAFPEGLQSYDKQSGDYSNMPEIQTGQVYWYRSNSGYSTRIIGYKDVNTDSYILQQGWNPVGQVNRVGDTFFTESDPRIEYIYRYENGSFVRAASYNPVDGGEYWLKCSEEVIVPLW